MQVLEELQRQVAAHIDSAAPYGPHLCTYNLHDAHNERNTSMGSLSVQVLEGLRRQVAAHADSLHRLVDAVALADVLAALATTAAARPGGEYTRPKFTHTGVSL